MDVKNAFLQGSLEEEVYMSLPPGHKFSSDSSLVWNSNEEIEKVKQKLKEEFNIKDLGQLTYFLGIEIAKSHKGLFLSQRKYVLDLLKETGKIRAKPIDTPIETKTRLNLEDGDSLGDIGHYQRLVEKLIYLTVTRPDISYAVNMISQFMHAPRTLHLDAVDRILRYLKGTPGQGIWMKNNNNTITVTGFSDADWVGSCERKSTSGFCTFVEGNLVTWKSKKQSVTARSSAEAEYRVMASTASELIWIKQVLVDMRVEHKGPMEMYCDNQAVRHIASNPVFHERT
eukprot:XP_015576586.1 uncharacterized protein LOC107261482 [Ricinus communis]